MKQKTLFSISVALLIFPQITFAAWWNPMSWFEKAESSQTMPTHVIEAAVSNSDAVRENTFDEQENKSQSLMQIYVDEIAALKTTIANLRREITALKNNPVIKEVIKEIPVEKIVYQEKIVEKPVEKIVYKDRVAENPVTGETYWGIGENENPISEQETYEQLHCPKVVKIEDSLGNSAMFNEYAWSQSLGGELKLGDVSSLEIKVTTVDPNGLPVTYTFYGSLVGGSIERQQSTNNIYVVDLSDLTTGGNYGLVITADIDNNDDYKCWGPRDASVVFTYNILP